MFRKAQNKTITVKFFTGRLEGTYFIIIWCFPLDDKITDHCFDISYTFLPFAKSQFKKKNYHRQHLTLGNKWKWFFSGYFYLLLGKTLNEREWQSSMFSTIKWMSCIRNNWSDSSKLVCPGEVSGFSFWCATGASQKEAHLHEETCACSINIPLPYFAQNKTPWGKMSKILSGFRVTGKVLFRN